QCMPGREVGRMTNSGAHRVERAIRRVFVEERERLDNPGRDERSQDEPLPNNVRARDRVLRLMDVLPDFVGEALAEILCRDGLFPCGAEIPHRQSPCRQNPRIRSAGLASMQEVSANSLESVYGGAEARPATEPPPALRAGQKVLPSRRVDSAPPFRNSPHSLAVRSSSPMRGRCMLNAWCDTRWRRCSPRPSSPGAPPRESPSRTRRRADP